MCSEDGVSSMNTLASVNPPCLDAISLQQVHEHAMFDTDIYRIVQRHHKILISVCNTLYVFQGLLWI